MAVTANQLISRQDGDIVEGSVLTAITLYIGTMAFIDAANGYITNVINAGANKFAGIVRDYVDNSAGASGAVKVPLYAEGVIRLAGVRIYPGRRGQEGLRHGQLRRQVSATSRPTSARSSRSSAPPR